MRGFGGWFPLAAAVFVSVFERIFLEHPRTVRESYGGHMLTAWGVMLGLCSMLLITNLLSHLPIPH